MSWKIIPYPLRAARLSLDWGPFCWWWLPRVRWNGGLTEAAKADGATIWHARWLCWQVSYSRWL